MSDGIAVLVAVVLAVLIAPLFLRSLDWVARRSDERDAERLSRDMKRRKLH